jgi:signal transduction histidine kinase
MKSARWLVLLITALLVLQGVWWYRAMGTAQREFQQDTRLRLQEVGKAIDKDAECFEFIARTEIPKGGTFAILMPRISDPRQLDTLESFYWEHQPKDSLYPVKMMELPAPVSVEITQRFTFLKRVGEHPSDSMSNMEQRVARSFARSIWRRKGSMQYKLLDTLFLAAMVDSMLVRPDMPKVEYAVAGADGGLLIYASPPAHAALVRGEGMAQPLFTDSRFADPMMLYVRYPGQQAALLRSFAPSVLLFLVMIGTLALMLRNFMRSLLQQRKLARMRIDLVNNITHEFNTPIANISLALDTLDRRNGSTIQLTSDELVGIIRAENQRLHANMEKVMEMCRMDAGQLHLRMEPVDLHELLHNVMLASGPVLAKAGVSVFPQFNALHPVVQGDRTYLSNVFFGLLDNAIKYGPPGTTIHLRTEEKGLCTMVEVADNGPGIREEDLQLVFEKFFRTDMKDRHDVKGTGLGLYLAKRIIAAHGGRIEAVNNTEGGVTIRIHLANAHHGRTVADRRG